MTASAHRLPSRLAAMAGALAVALGAGATSAHAADSCPNAQFRTGPSANLPDCRAYELVTPDLNHASGGLQPGGQATGDGKTFVYQSIDAPLAAQGATIFNVVRAERDSVKGWSGVSLSPPLPAPSTVFQGALTIALSADLSSTAEVSDQPLTGGTPPTGQNVFIRRPDGSYRLITNEGSPLQPFLNIYNYRGINWGTPDFSSVYYQSPVAQLQSDPAPGGSTYAWSEDRGLRLIGVLPNGTLAPNGSALVSGVLQPASSDGKYVGFTADGTLYLRSNDAQTVALGTVDIDPTRPSQSDQAGVAADGSKLLFTSRAELTGDANTGETGGVPNQSGRDLYRYDIGSGQLTDLTVDTNPADAATGANIQTVLATSKDGTRIYFTANGSLAAGAPSGRTSLYVWHDGRIDLIATTAVNSLYTTPDGRYVSFTSTESLTGYDNTDPSTGAPHVEVYKYSLGGSIECVSCRVDGSRPTGESSLPAYSGLGPAGVIRKISEDGRRLYFESKDAVLPQASNGYKQVFQYADGKVTALSALDGRFDATFLDASATGDDVFINTYDALVPDPNNGDYAVVDAKVGGGFPVKTNQRCASVACQTPTTPTPTLPVAGTIAFFGDDTPADDTSEDSTATPKVTVSKLSTINGTSGSLKVKVPGKGRITVSGSGLRTKRSNPTKAQTLTVKLELTRSATNSLRKKGTYKTKVKVVFSDSGGRTSTATLSVTFKAKAGAARKGR